MHGLEQVGIDLSFGLLAIKWGFVSGKNEAGLVGTHWVVWRVAPMLKTRLTWCFQSLAPFHVGSRAQELGCLLHAAPSCVLSAQVLFSCRRGLHPAERRTLSFSLQAAGRCAAWFQCCPSPTGRWIDAEGQDNTPEGHLAQASSPSPGCSLVGWHPGYLCRDTCHTSHPLTTTPPLQSTPELRVC